MRLTDALHENTTTHYLFGRATEHSYARYTNKESKTMPHRYNLHRFVDAQDRVAETVGPELREGRKRSHWMWYAFPPRARPQHDGAATRSGGRERGGHLRLSGLPEARSSMTLRILEWVRMPVAARLTLLAPRAFAYTLKHVVGRGIHRSEGSTTPS